MEAQGLNLEVLLLVAAVLLLTSALASKASSRLGIPTLLLFILLGMAAGSEGLGGIAFDDADVARRVGTIALVFILFSGGLDTPWKTIKPVLAPGLTLATVGVFGTAVLVGVFAHMALGLGTYEALLLGAIVSSTDAAAVFAVLRARSIRLRRRLGPMIEFESGSNDPTAVFLTLGLTGLILQERVSIWSLIPSFFVQMSVGAAFGYGLGRSGVLLINRLRLDYDGLYAAVTVGLALLAYAGTEMVGGNGFLGAYVAGLTLGNHPFVHRYSLGRFHDGIAWLMQIAMFVVLGLLSFPSRIMGAAAAGIALAVFLIVIARPLAVYLALLPFRMSSRERLFVGWIGLRGAVPIILATIPLTAGVPNSEVIFNLVFFAVLFSVALQGTTIGFVAKQLGVTARYSSRPEGPSTLQAHTLEVDVSGFLAGKRVVDLGLPNTAMILLLTRQGRSFVPQGSTVLEVGDRILVATRKDDADDIRVTLTGGPQAVVADSSG